MTDVFLSYSRRNQTFAREVASYLEKQGIEVWVDWNDIQISEDWIEAIFDGIESADNVVFILSPDSVISSVCHLELAHARQHSKRLIPIVFEEADKKQSLVEVAAYVPDALEQRFLGEKSLLEIVADNWLAIQRHNWLFFEGVATEDKLEQLVKSLHSDLSYVKMHTRLLKQANEWNANNHNPSFLLRGTGLQQAEEWLRGSGGKYPEPSQLMTAYIVDSRKQTRKRLRQLLASSMTVTVIMLVLAIASLILFRVAQQNAAEAHSLALASRSQTAVRTGDADLALALALAANEDDNPPLESQRTLFEMALAPSTRTRLDYEEPLLAVEWNPVDETVIAIREDGAILSFSVQHPEAVTVEQIPVIEAHFAAISPDGRVGVIADCVSSLESGTCEQYNLLVLSLVFAQLLDEIPLTVQRINTLEFDPTGTDVAIGGCAVRSKGTCEAGDLFYIRNIATEPTMIETQDSIFAEILSLEIWIGKDETRLLAGSERGEISIWTIDPDQIVFEDFLDDFREPVYSLEIDSGNQVLAIGDGGGRIRLWDMVQFGEVSQLVGHTSDVLDLSWLPGDRYLISGSADSSIILWDTHRESMIQQFNGHTASVRLVRASDSLLISASTDNTLRIWDMQHQAIIDRTTENSTAVFAVAVSPSDGRVLYGTRSLGVKGWMPNQAADISCLDSRLATSSETTPIDDIWDITFAPSGNVVWFSGTDQDGQHKIARWNLEACEIEAVLTGHQFPVNAIAISGDGHYLLSGSFAFPEDDHELFVWNVETSELERELEGHSDGIDAVDFSADGQLALSASHDGTVIVWRLPDWSPLQTFAEHRGRVTSARFTPNSRSIVSGDSTGILFLWNARTGEVQKRLRGHTDSIISLDISSDGRYAVSGGDDRSIRLWDVQSGEEIQRAVGHYESVWAVAFSPDGQHIASGSLDSSVIWWSLATFLQPISQIKQWTLDNRFITPFTCDERWLYDIKPLCD